MAPTNLLLLGLLGAIWGGSYLFIKVAVQEMSPLALSAARLTLGSLGLIVILRFLPTPGSVETSGSGGLRGRPLWWRATILGFFGAVVPYLLIAWAEEHIPSGEAAVLNATSPLFSTVLGHWWGLWGTEERLSLSRASGLLLGIVGVAVLAAGGGLEAHTDPLLLAAGRLAVVAASASYGVGALYARLAFSGAAPLVPATAQTVAAAVLTLPPALLFSLPAAPPSIQATGSLLALGVLGTTVAYLLYYRILASTGATGVLSVTYLIPAFALVYGAMLLGEPITPAVLAGLVLILAGTGLTTGWVRLTGRVPER